MSFIREKEIPPGSGNYYAYRVESYREDGTVKQNQTYLGPADGRSDSNSSAATDSERLGITDEAEIKEEFNDQVNQVWSNDNLPEELEDIEISSVEECDEIRGAVAAITTPDKKERAVGRHLMSIPQFERKLLVSEEFEELNRSEQQKILRHEAIHLGYPTHNSKFKQVAKEVDAPLTKKQMVEDKPFSIEAQRGKGKRFEPVESFADKSEAREFAREYAEENQDVTKVRMSG